jgi:hypothetical protein
MAVAASGPSVGVIDSDAVAPLPFYNQRRNDSSRTASSSGFRDERQAMVAHLIASAGGGDLEIAATIFSVFGTWALVAALLGPRECAAARIRPPVRSARLPGDPWTCGRT